MIFLLPRGLVGPFNSVIRVDRIEMLDGWHDGSVGGAVAWDFIGDQPSWLTTLVFQ
jgi:hypothetical protein